MPHSRVDPAILSYYSDDYDEDSRLRKRPSGHVEFIRTQELLRRHLPAAPATVLDIGGGTGIHAEWLAASGYTVQLLDPIPSHVAQASRLTGVEADVGLAGKLPYPDNSADVTLLLGPLYHLPSPADRALALREAVRVTRPDGLIAAAAISRYAGLLECSVFNEVDDDCEPSLRESVSTGVNAPDSGFTIAYFHNADELLAELDTAGLAHTTVYGVEGPSMPALMVLPPERGSEMIDSVLRTARLVEQDAAMIAASPHFLAVGRVPA
jgi:SAM-dependent methyltransferase